MTESFDTWRQRYEDGIRRLAKRLKMMVDSGYSPTPKRKEIEAIAQQLEDMANVLGSQGSAQFDIEKYHDKLTLDENNKPRLGSYQKAKWGMRDLARSARAAAEALPDARAKHALPFAAEALLYLRHDCGHKLPARSNTDPAISELDRLCTLAGMSRYSNERLRGALSDALDTHTHGTRPDYINGTLYGWK